MAHEARPLVYLKAWDFFFLQLHKELGVVHQLVDMVVLRKVFTVASRQVLTLDDHCRYSIVIIVFH